jgi:hypothetical protein
MFNNITDDKVDFYCDNRLAAIEDLDYVLTELKAMRDNPTKLSERIDKLIEAFKDE